MTQPTWGIVATVKEPSQLVLACVAYHLGLGASEAHIFLDAPDPDAQAALAALPGCHVTVTDEAYWAATPAGRRFPRPTSRQILNANRAYADCGVDWLLHLDADEFVRDGDQVMQDICEAPQEVQFIRYRVLERVYLADTPSQTILDGVFRRRHPLFDLYGDVIYGRFAKFLRHGLTGHTAGKAIVRTGQDLRMSIHLPVQPDGTRLNTGQERLDQLLHFDGLTPTHYLIKMARYAHLPPIKGRRNPEGKERGQQQRFVINHADRERELQRMIQGTQVMDAKRLDHLRQRALLYETPFDPTPQFAKMGVAPDLRADAFDATLRRLEPELFAQAAQNIQDIQALPK